VRRRGVAFVTRKTLVECAFLIPLRRDENLADGALHEREAWEWLDSQLFQFGGASYANETQTGWYVDPDTQQRIWDDSWRYTVALPRGHVRRLRSCLRVACEVLQQKCIYLSVAGQVEFVARRDDLQE
jgi:hypothetical protein